MSPLYEVGAVAIRPIETTTLCEAGIYERHDLQRLLRDQIDVVAPDVLIIAEEFGRWTDSRRRIDLLGVDREANLVVIELKRTEDGGHMELQALRYAAMASTLTAQQAVEELGNSLRQRGRDEDPRELLLEHLGWEDLDEERFGQDVRLVLVSEDFSRELTTAVIWLNDKDLDIRCVRIKPYRDQERTLIDVQQIIPLPESGDYQVQVREKRRQEREARQTHADFTRYDVAVSGKVYPDQWKRNAILLVVKALHERGVRPEELHVLFSNLGRGNTFLGIDEATESVDHFREVASQEAADRGLEYNDRRWHTKPGDLMVSDARTFAFTNQWGKHWPSFMKALQDAYPEVRLQFTPCGDPGSD